MKVFYLMISLLFFQNPSLDEIRKMYPDAIKTEQHAEELLSKLASISNDGNATLVAYKGASLTISSRFAKKVADKSKIFKEGVKLLESALIKEPENIEIRLIRLSIQENVPKIVHYKKNVKDDKRFLLENYKNQTGILKTYIKNFILQSKSFTASEKQSIR